jgi:hypothetical protein
VVYECLKTIANIYVNHGLVERAINKASVFLMSDDRNMKYIGESSSKYPCFYGNGII